MFYCSACNAALRPGQSLCQCGQVFPHPVPATVPESEYRAHYWPPKQATASEDTLRRVQTWWGGVSNRNKAIGGGALVLLIIVCSVPHPGTQDLQYPGGPPPYQNPHYTPPMQTASNTRPPPAAESPQVYVPPAPIARPSAAIQPCYTIKSISDNDSVIFVGNLDNFDWTNVRITINPGGGDYAVTTDVIHPSDPVIDPIVGERDSISFDIRDFADSMGNRYSGNLKIIRIQITCETPSGRAMHTMTFTN